MNHTREHNPLNIEGTLQQSPFENPIAQSFFTYWMKLHDDSINVSVVDREDWKKRRDEGILQQTSDGARTLYIPKDLQLWEMGDVIEAIDKNTFYQDSQRQRVGRENVTSFGRTLMNAGIYIAKRIDAIEEGRDIAEKLAVDFYRYGQALVENKPYGEVPENIPEISSQSLSNEQTQEIDRFFAGDSLYEEMRKRIESKNIQGEEVENIRKKKLNQFFRVAQRAFKLQQKSSRGEVQRDSTRSPWESDTPIHTAFLKKIEGSLETTVQTPRQELQMAVFRRGLRRLVEEMTEPDWKHVANKVFELMGFNLKIEQEKLADALNIRQLREDLKNIRRNRDPKVIAKKELEIANQIQAAVARFGYESGLNYPSQMIETHFRNCVGASMLGGALLSEVGLNYLVCSIPHHSVLLLVTADKRVFWYDMLNPKKHQELTTEMITGRRDDNNPLTVNDIVSFSRSETNTSLMFSIEDPKYRKKFIGMDEGESPYVVISKPEQGQMMQVWNNLGYDLLNLRRYDEAVQVFQQAIRLHSKSSYTHAGLGHAFSGIKQYEEAIESYKQAIAIDPKYINAYLGLGEALLSLKRYSEAIQVFQKAESINLRDFHIYQKLGDVFLSTGRYVEAIRAYSRSINLYTRELPRLLMNQSASLSVLMLYYVEQARAMIRDLRRKPEVRSEILRMLSSRRKS
ncbi:MAG: tetratricopeptide repeat protein [Patescibacteria group bacterium]|nr:tetratricopeptide repeat protein [Patescibacteria group bacterium]